MTTFPAQTHGPAGGAPGDGGATAGARPVAGARRRRRHTPRPEHAIGRALAGLLLVAGWSAVGHQSGSGWVVAVGGVVAATLLLAFVVPLPALLTTTLKVTTAPDDAEAGVAFTVAIACSRRVRLQMVEPPGEVAYTPAGGVALVPAVADRRGVLTAVEVRVATAAPFGLVWWAREVALPLPRPLHVAPRVGEPLPSSQGPDRSLAGTDRAAARAASGELRSVREYRHGDSPRHVHWPATAHGRTLMVREMGEDAGSTVLVRAELPPDADAGERRAERVFGTVLALQRAGTAVRLETTEADGRLVVAPVADRRAAGRRLALACSPVAADRRP